MTVDSVRGPCKFWKWSHAFSNPQKEWIKTMGGLDCTFVHRLQWNQISISKRPFSNILTALRRNRVKCHWPRFNRFKLRKMASRVTRGSLVFKVACQNTRSETVVPSQYSLIRVKKIDFHSSHMTTRNGINRLRAQKAFQRVINRSNSNLSRKRARGMTQRVRSAKSVRISRMLISSPSTKS